MWRITRLTGFVAASLFALCVAACGPSTDPAVEKVVKYGVNMHSAPYKALTPDQQAEALRLAKERNLPIIGNGERYHPGNVFSSSSNASSR